MQPFDLVVLALATYYAAVTLAKLHGPLGLAERWRHAVYRWRGFVAVRMGLVEQMDVWARQRRLNGGRTVVVDNLDDDWLAAGVGCPLCMSPYVGGALALAWLAGGEVGQAVVSVLAVAGAASVLFSVGRYW